MRDFHEFDLGDIVRPREDVKDQAGNVVLAKGTKCYINRFYCDYIEIIDEECGSPNSAFCICRRY